MKFLQLLTFALLFTSPAWASEVENHAAYDFKVAFINPGHPEGDQTGSFWSRVSQFMRAAADDLNIELNIVYAERNHIIMKSLLSEVSAMQPDYIILVNEKGVADDMLAPCAALDVPIFMLLNDFEAAEEARLTEQQRSLIIGSLKPDNFSAGRHLAEDLLALHRQKKQPPPIVFYALDGDYTTPAAQDRHAGLMSVLANNPHIEFIDNTVANWSKHEAYTKTLGMIQRYDLDIIWAANDPMAYGAKQAVNSGAANRPLIGGINWGMDEQEFPLDVSYGGHLTLGAKAMVMLYDYHHEALSRVDMYQVLDIFRRGSPQEIIRFNQLFYRDNLSKIDFTLFSATENAALPYTIDNLMYLAQPDSQ